MVSVSRSGREGEGRRRAVRAAVSLARSRKGTRCLLQQKRRYGRAGEGRRDARRTFRG